MTSLDKVNLEGGKGEPSSALLGMAQKHKKGMEGYFNIKHKRAQPSLDNSRRGSKAPNSSKGSISEKSTESQQPVHTI